MAAGFLVSGCGSIGRRHLRNLASLGAEPLWAWDPEPSRCARAAEESGAGAVTSLDEGLARGPAAALICSPSSFHAEQAIAAAAHCHLFIEKPVACSPEDAAAVRDAAGRHGRVTLVACNLRFHPLLRRLRQELVSGSIGRPLSARAEFGHYLPDWHPWEDYREGYSARRALGGGVLLDAIHEVDLLRWLFGELEEVRGIAVRAGELEIDTEDLALLIARAASGVWCEVHLDYLQRVRTRGLRVAGTEGTLEADLVAGSLRSLRPEREAETLFCRAVDYNEPFLEEMRHFLSCLAGQSKPEQDAAAAARLLWTLDPVRRL